MREADKRGEDLGLSQDELAFYDALAENQSAVEVLGNDQLRVIAIELVQTVRQNTTIDWTVKESVKARLRVLVRRALRKYGYPPDLQEAAVRTVLLQAELLAVEQPA
jgi:type I restriction enzyme, R subunit